MLDLNHIFLFVAVASPAVLLVQIWRGAADPNWRNAAAAVLVITAVAWLLAPAEAGFIGGGAWFFLLFLPATWMRKSIELAQRGDLRNARRLAGALRVIHPGRAAREHARVIDVIERAHQQGRAIPPITSRPSMFGRSETRLTRVVTTLIVVNLAMFVAQSTLGGSTNPITLHRLGCA